MAAGVAILFFGVVGFAKVTGHWQTTIPDSTYQVLVPHADEAAHPMTGQSSKPPRAGNKRPS